MLSQRSISNVKRILIYRVGHLGDTICAIPSMVAIRNKFPDARIILVTNSSDLGKSDCEQILQGNNFIDQIITYRSDKLKNLIYFWNFFKSIFIVNFDLLIYLSLSESKKKRLIRDWIFFKLARCKICIGFIIPKPVGSITVNGNILPLYMKETDRLMSLLSPLGIKPLPVNFNLPISQKHINHVDHMWQEYGLDQHTYVVGICPASKFQSKLWPIDSFVEVIRHLNAIKGVKVVLIGGASELPAGEYVCKLVGDSVINLIGKTGFMESAHLLSKCSLLVANDCGPVHLAAAVATPVVGIYASVHYPGAWHPWGDVHTILRNDTLSCRFCFKTKCSHQSCIISISPEQVVEACDKYLRN